MRILIIALSGIGDALMFTPAIRKLREAYPKAEINALVMFSGVKDIYSRLGDIDNIYHHDYLYSSKLKSLSFTLALRKKYDISINVYPSNRKIYNLISFMIGAKKRGAVKYLRGGSANFSFLNNVLIEEDDRLHNVEENLKLVSKLTDTKIDPELPLEFPLWHEELNFAETFLEKNYIKQKDLVIGFHPGCATLKNHAKRRWELEKFSALGKMLIAEHKAKILVFGGPDEIELKETILYKINMNNVLTVDTNSLAETAAVMKRCNVFVTNDSSLMHVASALKLNTVAIIGPTNTNYIHPWQTKYKIASLNLDCAPCFHYSPKHLSCSRKDTQFKCIKDLDVLNIHAKVKEFLYNYYGFVQGSSK